MIRRLMVEKLIIKEVVGGEEGDVKEKVKDFIQQTLTLILHFLRNTVDFFTKKFDELLPPDTRDETLKHWLHVGLTIVLPILLILLFLYCCCRCCCRCCCFRVARKMMKAPGRNDTLIPRNSFEANPRGYFRNLRGKDSDFVF